MPQSPTKSLCAQTFVPDFSQQKAMSAREFEKVWKALKDETILELQGLVEKGIDINAIILQAIHRRAGEVAEIKARAAEEYEGKLAAGAGEMTGAGGATEDEAGVAREKGVISEARLAHEEKTRARDEVAAAKLEMRLRHDFGKSMISRGVAFAAGVQRGQEKSRYIPAATRRILKMEYGAKCSYEGCTKQAVQVHHELGFAKYRSHNPRILKPLCRGHHELLHRSEKSEQNKDGASNGNGKPNNEGRNIIDEKPLFDIEGDLGAG